MAAVFSDGKLVQTGSPKADPRNVFVVHGRNSAARKAMFDFLRAIGLRPIEWSEALAATGSASPFIGEILDTAFSMARAIVVLMTPDELAYLLPAYGHGDDDPETLAKPQARPNVLFEAGMAMGRDPKRTVLVELGSLRPFSDVAGRHAVRLTNEAATRKDLAQRLRVAGCDVNLDGSDWLTTGDFSAPAVPGGGLPLGRRAASQPQSIGARLDGRYFSRSSGKDQIQIINRGDEAVLEIRAENQSEFPGDIRGFPIRRLPGGKDIKLSVLQFGNVSHDDTFDLILLGRTESGEDIREEVFLDLNG